MWTSPMKVINMMMDDIMNSKKITNFKFDQRAIM